MGHQTAGRTSLMVTALLGVPEALEMLLILSIYRGSSFLKDSSKMHPEHRRWCHSSCVLRAFPAGTKPGNFSSSEQFQIASGVCHAVDGNGEAGVTHP